MDHAAEKNNRVFLMGEIVSEAVFSHEVYGEGFYEFFVKVMRLSGQADILPVTISERLIRGHELRAGSMLCALGQFRSYNKLEGGRSRLMLTVFVREILEAEPAARRPASCCAPSASSSSCRSPSCMWCCCSTTSSP